MASRALAPHYRRAACAAVSPLRVDLSANRSEQYRRGEPADQLGHHYTGTFSAPGVGLTIWLRATSSASTAANTSAGSRWLVVPQWQMSSWLSRSHATVFSNLPSHLGQWIGTTCSSNNVDIV